MVLQRTSSRRKADGMTTADDAAGVTPESDGRAPSTTHGPGIGDKTPKLEQLAELEMPEDDGDDDDEIIFIRGATC